MKRERTRENARELDCGCSEASAREATDSVGKSAHVEIDEKTNAPLGLETQRTQENAREDLNGKFVILVRRSGMRHRLSLAFSCVLCVSSLYALTRLRSGIIAI